jgi:hypothetical protein
MNVCPNINTPEWKSLENGVGKFEAYRDFMETGGKVRTSVEVRDKLSKREQVNEFNRIPEQSLMDLANMQTSQNVPNIGINLDQLKNSKAMEFADQFSNALGIPYDVISSSEAIEITKKASNPWNGEAAFFVGGKVYFIKDRLSTDLVLHEFAHPLIRSISKENQQLFSNLYESLKATTEGQAIIIETRKSHSYLDEDSAYFKEEVIVKALTKEGLKSLSNEKSKGPFAKWVNELLYQFKQALRKVFGKTLKVSKLSTNTTLNELTDILSKGEKMEINIELISEEDIVAYNNDLREQLSGDIANFSEKELMKTVADFHDMMDNHIKTLRTNKNYSELADILFAKNEIGAIKGNLKKYRDQIINEAETLQENIEESKNRTEAVASSLIRLRDVMEKVLAHLEDLKSLPDNQENTHKVYYYNHLIKHWEGFINDFNIAVDNDNNKIASNSSLAIMVNGLQRDIKKSKQIVDEIYQKGSIDALYDQLAPMNENISKRYKQVIKDLEDNNADPRIIDRTYRQYHGMNREQLKEFNKLQAQEKKGTLVADEIRRLKELTKLSQNGISISKGKIEQLIKGQAADANWMNSNLEGYLYNTDPVIGGLALYTKNAINEVMIVTQEKMNDFAKDISEYAKKAGYNPTQLGKLGEDLGFVDIIKQKNSETGELEEKEVWTLLNPFKDYRSEMAQYKYNLQQAEDDYLLSKSTKDENRLKEAEEELKQFKKDYFYREYTDAYYLKDDLFTQDQTGIEASRQRTVILDRIKNLNEQIDSQLDEQSMQDEMDLLWREYRQLYMVHDLNGNLKSDVPDSNGVSPLGMAKRLTKHRNETRELHEWQIRKNAFETAYFDFQGELRAKNIEESSDPNSEWMQKMDQWKTLNSRTKVSDAFYAERQNIIDQIREIMKKLPASKEADKTVESIWQLILDNTNIYRDEDGQPDATQMTPDAIAKVKLLQEQLEIAKLGMYTRSGLTKEQSKRLGELFQKSTNKTINIKERAELKELIAARNTKGLDAYDIAKLDSLYSKLNSMSSREATDYYVDIMNNWLTKLDITSLKKEYKISSVDKLSASYLSDPKITDALLEQSPEFAEWFWKNHTVKEFYDSKAGATVQKYERIYVWNVVKPSNSSYLETYDILDAVGNVKETIKGVPSMKFYNRVVKNEYRQRRIIGETIDNQGEWLPKTEEDGAKDARFKNEKYYDLKNSTDPKKQAEFALLEKLKEHHLRNQEGLSKRSKLYLDFPRFRKAPLEVLRTTSLIKTSKDQISALTLFVQRIKNFIYGAEDQMEDGLSHENRNDIVRADMFDNEITDIPIAGLYAIDRKDVSTDIMTNMMRYMMSAERQKQLVKISPIVRAIENTVANAEDDSVLDDLDGKNFLARTMIRFKPKNKKVRVNAVRNFIEREFEGKTTTGALDKAIFNNFASLLFKRASFSFFALNLPSALKNSLGMKFQSMIEASAGKHMTHTSLQKGNLWAYEAMGRLSFGGELYSMGPRSHYLQMLEIFDPIQGRFEEKFAKQLSRTAAQDVASFSWLYSPRKWVETQAGVQLFGGMMYHQKVMRTLENGEKEEISYIDAFETTDGQIKLKSGIDVTWGQSPTYHKVKVNDTIDSIAIKYNTTPEAIERALKGKGLQQILIEVSRLEEKRNDELKNINWEKSENNSALRTKLMDRSDAINRKYDKELEAKAIKIDNVEFKAMKNKIHQVQNNMGGAYAKFDQPEAQRYLAFRFISYLRRYFTTMATNRWSFSGSIKNPQPRVNPGLGEAYMGFYIQTGQTIVDALRTGGSSLSHMNADEKGALFKMASEIGYLVTISMLMGLIFGWDDDDPDRYAKLREKAGGPMGFFGMVSDDPARGNFNPLGFLEIHTLHLMMQVRAENEQFNLITGGLKQYSSLLDLKSVAFGPTTDSYLKIWDDSKKIMTGDPKAYYSRKVGPYRWQDKESAKLYNRVAKTFGLTGSSLDPALAIQNFQSYQAKIR